MYHLSTRMVSLLLTFGIFFALSCSTFKTSSKTALDLYESGNYNNALRTVNLQIEDSPDDQQLRILKAEILQKIAVENYQPENRESVYSNLRTTTDEITFSTDRYQSKTDSILNSAWMHEQSAGVRLLQQDGTDSFDQYFDRVIAHFKNAVTIIPDSIVTYNLMATTYYRHGNLSEAINTLEAIEDKGFTRPPETCEKLAYLYLEAGQIEQSVKIYETLSANNPESEIYQQGLVNSYILGDMHTDAIALLEELTDVYPNRVQYREALATERFYQMRHRIYDETQNPGFETYADQEIDELLSQLNEIGSIYRDIDETLPSSEERQQRIAAFYVSAADMLNELQPHVTDTASARLTEQEEFYLRESIPYWQSLYEANSDRAAYAYSLIEVYTELGMESEAELLEQQINF
ncbi:tetratricopeptide repeat protein [Rhodohalobacter sp. 8-1]|uniref:tetratricopeptide repeat protein n=1 Tax=Rhodohalobacter sp. 8-1 TaxID=3131972 RepID=UPI0030EC5D51